MTPNPVSRTGTGAPPGPALPGPRTPSRPSPPEPTAAVPAPVDATRWPDVARVPARSRIRGGTARLLLTGALGRLPVRTRLGDAPARGAGPTLAVHDPDAFFRRVGAHGLVGFGESYMAGEWDSDDLVGLLTLLASHVDDLVPAPLRRLRRLWAGGRPAEQRNTEDGARENIHRHYDLSNELFALFLDETMSYSSAVFAAFPARRRSLPAAQHRKIDRLLDLAGVSAGTRLLEIGTGWGELALRAAARGADVVTVTLSAAQRDLARRRVAGAGLSDRVTVELLDYRQVTGVYDAVVSVEMIEAVGAEYWPVYFATLRRVLAPHGRIALQAITMGHERMLNTARTHTFISKYVFPGGLIPSPEALQEHACAAGLRVTADQGFGEHYAETLRLWRERFLTESRQVARLGFDTTFRRLWELYLAYCEAGFRSRYLDVRQIALTGGAAPSRPADHTVRTGPADQESIR